MASISGTSSLGNTSLRGFGGLASGIDRDSMIEQMTLGTTTKITNLKKSMTSMSWKQESFQGLSDKILDLYDNYFSYTSTSNLKNASLFARNQITSLGDSDVTKFVKATGTSSMVDYLSILGVKSLASSAVRESAVRGDGSLDTKLGSLNDEYTYSDLEGTQLRFGIYNNGAYDNTKIFNLPTSYKDDDGNTHTIDYRPTDAAGFEQLANDLNKALEKSGIKLGSDKINEVIKFEYDSASGQMKMNKLRETDFVIQKNSTALKGLGYQFDSGRDENGISLEEYNNNLSNIQDSYTHNVPAVEFLKGKKLTFNLDGSRKEIELLTSEEAAAWLSGTDESGNPLTEAQKMTRWKDGLQNRINAAYGYNKVEVNFNGEGNLAFSTTGSTSTVSITSNDTDLLKNLGVEHGASSRVNLNATLDKANLGSNFDNLSPYENADGSLNLVINGVEIKGLTKSSTIADIVDKINTTTDAGVKASYSSSTGKFMLVASETGSGRQISLDSSLAENLFGGAAADGAKFTEGKDAMVKVSYGNGVVVDLVRSSNTFDLEGMKVTVSGEFGYVKNSDGSIAQNPDGTDKLDSSQAVTFSAKADVDGVTEKVKKFFEEYNEFVQEVKSQSSTKPNSSYGPLTDEQKDEMSETSIENWEKKAKQGLLYNNSVLRDLSDDLQNVFLGLVGSGAEFDDLEEMGITIPDDWQSGGIINFDETAFKNAMTNNPDKVANVFAGGGNVSKGLGEIIDDTLARYATRYASRNGNSYGRLIEEAGSEKVPLSITNNFIYKRLKEMESNLDKLQSQLVSEQDRYIRQFSSMETMINQMNSQSSWLSQLQG